MNWTESELKEWATLHPDQARRTPGLGVEVVQQASGTVAPSKQAPGRNHPEKDLEQFVHDACNALQLCYYHTHRSKFSVPGFPDCIIIGRYLLVVELKDTGKNPTPAQQKWLEAFLSVGIEARVWRPEDRSEIMKTLEDMCRI